MIYLIGLDPMIVLSTFQIMELLGFWSSREVPMGLLDDCNILKFTLTFIFKNKKFVHL